MFSCSTSTCLYKSCVFMCASMYVCVCSLYLLSSTLWSSPPLASLIKAQLQDTSSSSSSSSSSSLAADGLTQGDDFLGVWRGVTVYITQRILLKRRSPSVLNSGLISSTSKSLVCAAASLNGRSGCYGRPGLSYLLTPVGDSGGGS